jgi:uncharacterized membrane protein
MAGWFTTIVTWFGNPEVTLSAKLLELLFFVMGLVTAYVAVKNLLDKTNPKRFGTAVFWIMLAVVLALGRFINPRVNGVLILIMALAAILRQVGPGETEGVDPAYSQAMSNKFGYTIFIPTLSIGLSALAFALFTKLGALVGIGFGVILAIVILMFMNRDNKPSTFLNDFTRMIGMIGPLSMLPMLLASLGAIFTKAGVGDVIAGYVGKVIPEGNVTIGLIVFAIAMPVFTIIMGNAFAAITVITVGIGFPFVLQYINNPAAIGMLALTCGYCGTLCTPMAANFNIVPVALLEMKDRFGVIKKQWIPAILILIFQIIYMFIIK